MPGSDQPEEVSPFPVGRLTLDTTPIDGNRQTPLTPPVRRAKMPQDRSGEGGKAITTPRNHGRNRIESRDHDRRDEDLLLDPANNLGESRVPLPLSVPLLGSFDLTFPLLEQFGGRAEPAGLEVSKRVNVETKAPCDLVRPHSCITSPCHEIVKP